jgi:hypothetical protein
MLFPKDDFFNGKIGNGNKKLLDMVIGNERILQRCKEKNQ